MLTRLIRIQLVLFSIVTVLALVFLGWYYLRLPTLAGVGQYTLYADLPASGGLYKTANVTYRGHPDRQGHRCGAHRAGRAGDDAHQRPVQDPGRRVGERAFGVGDR